MMNPKFSDFNYKENIIKRKQEIETLIDKTKFQIKTESIVLQNQSAIETMSEVLMYLENQKDACDMELTQYDVDLTNEKVL